MKNPAGIMQGRLSSPVGGKIQAFPWETWGQEFDKAKEVGLNCIDWIVEADKLEGNPLLTDEGTKSIKALISNTGVYIGAVCADYFMDCPLIRCSSAELAQRLGIFEILINRLAYIGIKYLEIPFVDHSAINNKAELAQIVQVIKPRLDNVYQRGITLAFETSLSPEMFRAFLDELNHPAARANYDMGNSASLGYRPKEELGSYGEFVVTVHIKDRVLKGGTVPLGQGNTDFDTCFSMLKAKGYSGPYILQVARTGNEIEAARKNISFIKKYLD